MIVRGLSGINEIFTGCSNDGNPMMYVADHIHFKLKYIHQTKDSLLTLSFGTNMQFISMVGNSEICDVSQ